MSNSSGKPLPNCRHLQFLPLPNIAQYWAIETGTDPGDNLRELAFAVHCWLLCENEFKSAYRKSGDPKFLEAVFPNNKEKLELIGEALKKLYLDNVSLDAPIEQTLAAITIYAEDMKDWCQRNHRPLPRFWFPCPYSESSANKEDNSAPSQSVEMSAEPGAPMLNRFRQRKPMLRRRDSLVVIHATVDEFEAAENRTPTANEVWAHLLAGGDKTGIVTKVGNREIKLSDGTLLTLKNFRRRYNNIFK